MDPMNNPTPTPNPVPAPDPSVGPAPEPVINPIAEPVPVEPLATPEPAPVAPIAPEPAPVAPVAPEPAPAAPLAPEPAPIAPEPAPVIPEPTPIAPEPAPTPETPASPVNPVVPGVTAPSNGPAIPFVSDDGGANPAPVNPVIAPGGMTPGFQAGGQGFSATEPIMMPEPVKAPDPIEEELKSPMKAAAPVPGSIGSAVSGPVAGSAGETSGTEGNPFANNPQSQTPSVAFNDPAAAQAPGGVQPAKKVNKTTLIILIAIAAVIVVILAVILIIQLTSGNGGSQYSQSGSSSQTADNSNNNNPNVPNTDSGNSSNSGNDNGSGGNSGNTNNGSNTSDLATIAIVCTSKSSDETADYENSITFNISNQKIVNASLSSNAVSKVDGSTNNSSTTMTLDELIGEGGELEGEESFIRSDGTLLVDVSEVSTAFQNALNVDISEPTSYYSCNVLL